MGKKLHNKGPKKGAKKGAKKKPMSRQLLFRHSPFNDQLGSVQPWEVWLEYEDARRAWKKMSPGRARNMAKRKAKAALVLGLWEIDRIEENGRARESRKNRGQRDDDPGCTPKQTKPPRQGKREEGPDVADFVEAGPDLADFERVRGAAISVFMMMMSFR